METVEIVDVVDENDRLLRKAARSEVEEKKLLHRVSRVIVVDKEGRLLVQKRSASKKTRPGWWDIGVTETLQSGESYESAAIRGLAEEVGIMGISTTEIMRSSLVKARHKSQTSNVICKVYGLMYNGNITPDHDEVEEASVMAAEKVEKLIDEGKMTPGGIETFRKFSKLWQSISEIRKK